MVASPLQPRSSAGTSPSGAAGNGCGSIVAARDSSGVVTLEVIAGSRSQNVIDGQFLRDLRQSLDALEAGPPPRAVVVCSGRPGSFFAGADIDRLEAILGAEAAVIEQACADGRQLYGRLSSNPWPTVAVIDGVCLGGGLEIALACDYRVATSAETTVLGFPEVKLGLLPGWGGTVRLPRLIGPGPAVEMIAAGETMSGAAAARLGLVDACVPAAQALAAARLLVDSATGTGAHRILLAAVEETKKLARRFSTMARAPSYTLLSETMHLEAVRAEARVAEELERAAARARAPLGPRGPL